MNRAERRVNAAVSRALQPTRPARLTRVADDVVQARCGHAKGAPIEVWESREFLAQLFAVGHTSEGRAPSLRLTVCRVTYLANGRQRDGITWEDLQRVKRDVGRGEQYAVEVYPRDADLVNVANMRHLWLFDEPLDCGWFARGGAS